jgi:hypothetical protein
MQATAGRERTTAEPGEIEDMRPLKWDPLDMKCNGVIGLVMSLCRRVKIIFCERFSYRVRFVRGVKGVLLQDKQQMRGRAEARV